MDSSTVALQQCAYIVATCLFRLGHHHTDKCVFNLLGKFTFFRSSPTPTMISLCFQASYKGSVYLQDRCTPEFQTDHVWRCLEKTCHAPCWMSYACPVPVSNVRLRSDQDAFCNHLNRLKWWARSLVRPRLQQLVLYLKYLEIGEICGQRLDASLASLLSTLLYNNFVL